MIPSGHRAFLVSNVKDVELLLMHNRTHAAEYVFPLLRNQGGNIPGGGVEDCRMSLYGERRK